MTTDEPFSQLPAQPPFNRADSGTNEVVPQTDAPVADAITLQTAQVLENPPPTRTWLHSAILLVVSLVVFAGIGMFSWTPTDLVLLVAILFLHESGHYLGMRMFNYQDVKMFFIPFFGAAVSGRASSVAGYKEAIVLLLGPLPGIFLGIALGMVCMFEGSQLLRTAALMLIGINGFNLLPLMPLDGGRVLHLIVFSRQRHVEALFNVATAALLGLMALGLGAWALGIFAVLILIGVPTTFQVAGLAKQLRQAFQPAPNANPAAPLPHELAVSLAQRMRAAFPQVTAPSTLAGLARQVWERMHLRPPGLIASVLLLGVSGATIVVMLAAIVVFNFPIPARALHKKADGATVAVDQVRVWGQVRTSQEVDADGIPHGRYVEYFPYTDDVHIEGAYSHGTQDGVWTTYREDGQVESQETYRDGELVVPKSP
jgi:Zn-dependent protease